MNHAIIIGAGIAGAATTYSLSCRGWQCTVLEQRTEIAAGASGNRQGIVYPLLSRNPRDMATQFYLSAYLSAWRQLTALTTAGHAIPYARCGVLQCATETTPISRLQAIVENLQLPADLLGFMPATATARCCGLELASGGLWFPNAGWVSPAAWCRAQLAASPHSQVKLSTDVQYFIYEQGEWQVFDAQQRHIAHAPVLILANAYAITQFAVAASLPLQAVRGQVTEVLATPLSAQLQAVVCGSGYITPAWQGQHCLGATFTSDDLSEQHRVADDVENLAQLTQLAPALAKDLRPHHARSRVRCSSVDHLPLVGPLAEVSAFQHAYADLAQGKRFSHYPAPPYLPGLYVNVGHGARGLVSAPLAGEILASLLNQEALPVPMSVLNALNPQRFWVRALKSK